jgi:UDP-N-acetylglucosamine 2-epimerase
MRVLLVGNSGKAAALAEELTAADLVVARWHDDPKTEGAADEIGLIARELRELERVIGQDSPPDAVLVTSDSSAAVAAVLVATKLGTPVGRIELAGDRQEGMNALLIRQLADAPLAAEAASIANWVRGSYTARA